MIEYEIIHVWKELDLYMFCFWHPCYVCIDGEPQRVLCSAPMGIEKCLVIVDIKGVGYKNMDLKGMLLGLQVLQVTTIP